MSLRTKSFASNIGSFGQILEKLKEKLCPYDTAPPPWRPALNRPAGPMVDWPVSSKLKVVPDKREISAVLMPRLGSLLFASTLELAPTV
jgi:hypothetical protein